MLAERAENAGVIRRLLLRFIPAVILVAGAPACSGDDTPGAQSTSPASSTSTSLARGEIDVSPGRHLVTFDVDGVPRTAVLVVPEGSGPAPLVFAFHGHGGQGSGFADRLGMDDAWPEAIVVYPDGLPGHRGRTDPTGVKPGWQTGLGELGDRDVAFYDTMLSELRAALAVDDDRVYVMGHSNGSAFAALLVNQRGRDIAAAAHISAPPAPRLLATDPARSMFVSMGEKDRLVPFERQVATIPFAERRLEVDPSKTTETGPLRLEHGRDGLELAVYTYPGGHELPPGIAEHVADFFRRHALPTG